jgi:hypothetical protein
MAAIASADQHGYTALDVALVAHLAKFDLFHMSCDAPCFAEGAGGGFIVGCHLPRPRRCQGANSLQDIFSE